MIVGIDEVGRGCWAGPLVAGAVLLPDRFELPEDAAWRLGDSKVLTKRQRIAAADGLQALGAPVGLGWVDAREIDDLGLTKAVSLAMQRALDAIVGPYDEVIIDGAYNFLPHITLARTVIRADSTVPAVGAASIVAKVARDTWMETEAARLFPGYGFERHVGYGTLEHRQALERLGPCDLHRHSYKPVKNATHQSL